MDTCDINNFLKTQQSKQHIFYYHMYVGMKLILIVSRIVKLPTTLYFGGLIPKDPARFYFIFFSKTMLC